MRDISIRFDDELKYQADMSNIHSIVNEVFTVVKFNKEDDSYWVKQKDSNIYWTNKDGSKEIDWF